MMYILTTRSGKVMPFYVKALAELFQILYGGAIKITRKTIDMD